MNINTEALRHVLPENTAALSESTTMRNIPNISTEHLQETPEFNTHALSESYAAQSVIDAQIDLIGAGPGINLVNQFRMDLKPIASQVSRLVLPDTRVSIKGHKIEVPFSLKQYALELDQARYLQILFALLEQDRLDSIRKHALRSNQAHTPALWLNQKLYIETKLPTVYQLAETLTEADREALDTMDGNSDQGRQLVRQALVQALGGDLCNVISQIAEVNKVTLYVVFVVLVNKILAEQEIRAEPVTAHSIWDFSKTVQEQH